MARLKEQWQSLITLSISPESKDLTVSRVLDVGNCSYDHASIKRMIQENFEADVAQTHTLEDTLARLRDQAYDLVLINRKLDKDSSEGIEILKAIKVDAHLKSVPVMLISNFAEHQDSAVALGAVRGFGKQELAARETKEKLLAVLGSDRAKRSESQAIF